jgi:rubrerythrin
MEERQDLTTLEVLTIGIKAEMAAQALYSKMKEMSDVPELQDTMDFLIGQEERHEHFMRKAFNDQFPDVEIKVPEKSVIPGIEKEIGDNAGMKELFEFAMEKEKIANEFYTDLASKTRDPNSRKLLEYIASMELSHLAILKAEYHKFELSTDQDLDDFLRGERMMHFGP